MTTTQILPVSPEGGRVRSISSGGTSEGLRPLNSQSHSTGFRPDIEGLRGVAVLLVVFYHVGLPGLTGGYIGVDVFFVMSGYLITRLLVEEISHTGRVDLIAFYGRRARRLLPAAAVVLLITILVGTVILSPLEQERTARTALATALYASNLWFMSQASDYFGSDTESNPFLHTWSLSVEEQFYLVWPLFVAWAFRGQMPRRRLLAIVSVLSVLSWAGSLWLTDVRQPWAFFGMPARAWEFGVGAAACLPAFTIARLNSRIRSILGWVGMSAILGAAVIFSEGTSFPGIAALLPALGTVGVLVAGGGSSESGVARFLSTPALRRAGQLSYSWYLWHWPVLVYAAAIVPHIPLWIRILLAFASLGLAAITYRTVEQPIRLTRSLSLRPALTLVLTLVLTVVGATASVAFDTRARRIASGPDQKAFSTARRELPRLFDLGCAADIPDRAVKECTFGTSTSTTTVVLFGDSHAAQWFPALERLSNERGWRLITMAKVSCPVARVPAYNMVLQRDYAECTEWREAALRRIIELRPAAVVAGTFSMREAKGIDESGSHLALSYDEWEHGIRSTLRTLDDAGVRTIYLHDTPFAGFDVPSCLSKAAYLAWYDGDQCQLRRSDALDPLVVEAERRAASGLLNVTLADFTDLFCSAQLCATIQNGHVVYRDGHHLSVGFTESLVPALAMRLAPLVKRSVGGNVVGVSGRDRILSVF